MKKLTELLKNNSYPGRGIVVNSNRVYYFIMGRSANSRNRVFTLTDDGIKTEAYDSTKVEDPSLIMYHPVRKTDLGLIVTNGDQTDTIAQLGDFKQALMTREYEPDAPNYTPRISAVIYPNKSFEIAILKECGGTCLREFFCYEKTNEQRGYFISTYSGDGNPLPSFSGEPIEVDMPEPQEVWDALNADNKVSLYAFTNSGVTLFNKNLGD